MSADRLPRVRLLTFCAGALVVLAACSRVEAADESLATLLVREVRTEEDHLERRVSRLAEDRRAAQTIIDWIEVDGPAGSGQLMGILSRLLEPRPVHIRRAGRAELRHRGCVDELELLALCESIERYDAQLADLAGRDRRAREPLESFLDRVLDRGAWIHLYRDTMPDVMLDYEKSVVLLRDAGASAPLRTIIRRLDRDISETERVIEMGRAIQDGLRQVAR